jgi:serine/threonine-protein kinase
MVIDVGEIVHGKYKLVRLLGRGGMGEVWIADHVSLGEQVAIKFLIDSEGEGAEPARQRFLFEAQVAARLSRKTRHVVSVIDHGEERGTAYLVMELLNGETLEALLARAGRLPLPQAEAILAQAARALSVAHAEGIFHRDLKPANIFLAKDDDGQLLVKLLDFGIARRMRVTTGGPPRTTARGMVLGTPSYMSPEQVQGLAKLDHRCDLWALAVVAYEMLAGELPFGGDTPEASLARVLVGRYEPLGAKRPELAGVDAFLSRSLAANIEERYPTAAALADAFKRMATGPSTLASVPPSSSSTTSARRALLGPSRARPVVIVGAAVLVGAVAAVALLGRRPRESSPPSPSAATLAATATQTRSPADPPTESARLLVSRGLPPAPAWTIVPPPEASHSPSQGSPPSVRPASKAHATALAPSVPVTALRPTPAAPPPPPPTASGTAPRPVNKDEVF